MNPIVVSGVAVAAAAAAALGAGCRASPLQDRFEAVSRDIRAAEAAGAEEYAPRDYVGARSAYVLARSSEEAALDAREAAERVREETRRELAALDALGADRQLALAEAERRLAGAQAHLAKLRRREAELRASGATPVEVERAVGDDIALAQLEVSAARASIKTIEAEIELVTLRRREAEARIESASDGIAAAGQQLLHASALCDTAGATARAAQAQAIARRKAELKVR